MSDIKDHLKHKLWQNSYLFLKPSSKGKLRRLLAKYNWIMVINT